MKNLKIWIDADGVIKAIDAPVEPKEPDYGDCEMDAADLHITGAEVYTMRMAGWTKDMQDYNEALAQAKKEGVMFNKQSAKLFIELVWRMNPDMYGTRDEAEKLWLENNISDNTGHYFDIPENYCVGFGSEFKTEKCRWITIASSIVPKYPDDNYRKVALLKKIEPQLKEKFTLNAAIENLEKLSAIGRSASPNLSAEELFPYYDNPNDDIGIREWNQRMYDKREAFNLGVKFSSKSDKKLDTKSAEDILKDLAVRNSDDEYIEAGWEKYKKTNEYKTIIQAMEEYGQMRVDQFKNKS